MTPQQRKTAMGCFVIVAGLFLLGLYALYVELTAVAGGGHATISELQRALWAFQPWVVFLVSHVVAGPVWFLAGHFYAAPAGEYDRIRRDGL